MLFRGKNSTFSNPPKSDWAAIYSRAVLHIQKVSFWLKAVYLYTILGFESQRPSVHLPFLPPRGQSRNSRFSNLPKSDWAAIYSRVVLHIQKVSFWLKAVYLYTILGFESQRPSVHLPFLPPSRQSQNSSFCKSAEVHLRRNLFPGPLTHSEGLLLAQSSLSIHYPTVWVS